MKKPIQISSQNSLMAIRIIIGTIFIVHGTIKLLAGQEQWQFLGEQLQLFGIDFLPVAFGLLAALSEFIGGILLTLGRLVKVASVVLIGTMTVALVFMIRDTGNFGQYAYPLTNLLLLSVFLFSKHKNTI